MSTPGPEDRVTWAEAQERGLGDEVGLVEDKDLPEGIQRVDGWKKVGRVLGERFGGKTA